MLPAYGFCLQAWSQHSKLKTQGCRCNNDIIILPVQIVYPPFPGFAGKIGISKKLIKTAPVKHAQRFV